MGRARTEKYRSHGRSRRVVCTYHQLPWLAAPVTTPIMETLFMSATTFCVRDTDIHAKYAYPRNDTTTAATIHACFCRLAEHINNDSYAQSHGEYLAFPNPDKYTRSSVKQRLHGAFYPFVRCLHRYPPTQPIWLLRNRHRRSMRCPFPLDAKCTRSPS